MSYILNYYCSSRERLNYKFQIVDEVTKEAAVVDPVEPENILEHLKGKDIKLTKILTTHHHWYVKLLCK